MSAAWPVGLMLLLALLLGGVGSLTEVRHRVRHPQGGGIYAAGLCRFATLAWPGFVWRMLRRRPAHE